MRHGREALLWALLLLSGWGVGTGFAATVEEATQAEADGRFTEAVALWEQLVAQDAGVGQAGLLRVLRTVGDYERLEREARAALEADPKNEDAALDLALALEQTGRAEEGAKGLETRAATSPRAAALRARLLDLLGRHEEAGTLWSRLVREYDPDLSQPPANRMAYGEAAAARGDPKGAEAMFETAYLDSSGFLDARLALAYLFQEKHESELAGNELALAGRLYPQHPDVHLATARLALENTQLARAEEAARAVLLVRPRDADARGVLAWLSLVAEQPEDARKQLEGVLDRNPTDLHTRSLLAAAGYMKGDSSSYHAERDRIAAQDPVYLEGFMDLGRVLELSRRNDEAFAQYAEALRRVPNHSGALIATGLLAMREGLEEKGKEFLERGFEKDPFNVRAFNQLQLLDTLAVFESYHSKNFEVRLDAGSDSLLVPLLLEQFERLRADLVRLHGWQPPERTLVEVFPSHDWFSARVTGLDWIGGIPAVCFGDVVAMDSPRTLAGTSNWEQIVRHEFGHVLALGMTAKRVPFWFTEGLSVFLEQYPRGEDWEQNLVGAYVDGEIVGVDSLTIAFTRPKRFSQRLLAYHESSLIIEDIVKEHGWESIPRLLQAFKEGKDLDAAVSQVLRVSPKDFRKRSMSVIRKTAASLSLWPAADPARFQRLSEEWETKADDPEYLALFALTAYQVGEEKKAREAADTLLTLEPENPRGLGILGLLDQAAGEETAEGRLERAVKAGSRDLEVVLALGEAVEGRQDTTAALDLYAQALSIYPRSEKARHARARLLAARGEKDAARAEYAALLTQNAVAWQAGVELARLDLEDGRGPEAIQSLDYVQATVPLNADVEALRGQAFLLTNRDAEAYALFQRARSLDMRSVEAMVGLARYYLKREDPEEAAFFAQLALKYAPDHRVAQAVLRSARGEP